MDFPSISGDLNFAPNIDDINNVEEIYYEQNDMNYTHPFDKNVDMDDDNVAAPEISLIDRLMNVIEVLMTLRLMNN